jgi:hypothetical protein
MDIIRHFKKVETINGRLVPWYPDEFQSQVGCDREGCLKEDVPQTVVVLFRGSYKVVLRSDVICRIQSIGPSPDDYFFPETDCEVPGIQIDIGFTDIQLKRIPAIFMTSAESDLRISGTNCLLIGPEG